MKQIIKSAIAIAVITGVTGIAYGAVGVVSGTGGTTVTGTVASTIARQQMSVSLKQELTFGTITVGNGAGTYAIPADNIPSTAPWTPVPATQIKTGVVATTPGTAMILGVTGTSSTLEGTGYTLVLPAGNSITLAGPAGATMTVAITPPTLTRSLNYKAAAGEIAAFNTLSGYSIAQLATNQYFDFFSIGGTLSVGASQRTGDYTGSLPIEIAYQ